MYCPYVFRAFEFAFDFKFKLNQFLLNSYTDYTSTLCNELPITIWKWAQERDNTV